MNYRVYELVVYSNLKDNLILKDLKKLFTAGELRQIDAEELGNRLS